MHPHCGAVVLWVLISLMASWSCKLSPSRNEANLSAVISDTYVLSLIDAYHSDNHYVFYICPKRSGVNFQQSFHHGQLQNLGCGPAFIDVFGREEPYYIPKNFITSQRYHSSPWGISAQQTQELETSAPLHIMPFSSVHAQIMSIRSGIMTFGWVISAQGRLAERIAQKGLKRGMASAQDVGKSAYITIQGKPHQNSDIHEACINTLKTIATTTNQQSTSAFDDVTEQLIASLDSAIETNCKHLKISSRISSTPESTLVEAYSYIFTTNTYKVSTLKTPMPELLETIAALLYKLNAFEDPFETITDPQLLYPIKPQICLPIHAQTITSAFCLPSEISWSSASAQRLAQKWSWNSQLGRFTRTFQSPSPLSETIYHRRYNSASQRP
ncbi:MAG: hypothetical protein OXC44_00750 [Proteobacteria bacterium]|nr:hypothetical protein [Pseudomonadota bacterium]